MKRWFAIILVLSLAAGARGGAVQYEQIPSDVVSYVHFDVERFVASRIWKLAGAANVQKQEGSFFLSQAKSGTVYFFGINPIQTVILLRSDADLRARAQAYAAKAKDALLIKYADQDIYYSSEGLLSPFPEIAAAMLGRERPKEANGTQTVHGRFTLALGNAAIADDREFFEKGPSYRAFVGQDLIVMTSDIRSMAKALDVLHGTKPSLAKEDPGGLKMDVPNGAILTGVGLNGQLIADNTDEARHSTSKPANHSTGSTLNLDLFGSFTGSAQVAQVCFGEDDQADFADLVIKMSTQETAEQLKNLVGGVKALIILSQPKRAALIAPLDVQAENKNVHLHWSWPTEKLPELKELLEKKDGDTIHPSTNPDASSAH